MIGNEYLQVLYDYPDRDTSINQILELLKSKDKDFINSLKTDVPDINLADQNEMHYLVIISALIDYCLQLKKIEVPSWLRRKELSFDKPYYYYYYYYSKRITDFDKVRLLFTNPSPFRLRNVYFELEGFKRI